MAEFGTCKRCRWEYLQEMSFVRRQPWTADDAGLMFQQCERCGQLSIQRFTNDGSVAGVWFLHPEAIVLFRMGVVPNAVFDYVFSDDFFRNRGITTGLLQGYLGSMLDLSGFANLTLNRLSSLDDAGQVSLCLEVLTLIVSEHARRASTGDEPRLAIRSLGPVADLMSGRQLSGPGVDNRVDIRFAALELLENFAQPELWKSVPSNETSALEDAIDHMKMVDQSAARMRHIADNLDDELLAQGYVEAKFVYRLFRRRQARLSRMHAEAVWRLMRMIEAMFDVQNPLTFAPKTFAALRALLEHQLVESGFFKVGARQHDGISATGFRSPNTGEVLALPENTARLFVYATPSAQTPTAVLDRWLAAMDRL